MSCPLDEAWDRLGREDSKVKKDLRNSAEIECAAIEDAPLGDLENAILSAARRFLQEGEVYIYPDIPSDKLATARRKCDVPLGCRTLVLIDCSLTGSAKYCVVIGSSGIYFRHFCDKGSLSYDDLSGLEFEEKYLCVTYTNGTREIGLSASAVPVQEFLSFLNHLKTLSDRHEGVEK
jgi:hypothetical protein